MYFGVCVCVCECVHARVRDYEKLFIHLAFLSRFYGLLMPPIRLIVKYFIVVTGLNRNRSPDSQRMWPITKLNGCEIGYLQYRNHDYGCKALTFHC